MSARQKVLVTGASGFLGAHLTGRLVEEGDDVFGVSRSERRSDHPSLHWLQSDLSTLADATRVFESVQPDVVYHLAGLTHAVPGLDLVPATFESHLASSVWILTAATRTKCSRVILSGSLEEPSPDLPLAVPESPYGAAKWAARGYARMFHRLYGTPVVVARIHMGYGPGQAERKLIPSSILSLLRGEAPRVMNPDRRVDWIFVDDLIDGLRRLAEPGLDGEELDLGSGQLVSVREVVELLAAKIDARLAPDVQTAPDQPGSILRPADVTRTFDRIGWRSATSLSSGLDATIAYYRTRLGIPS